MFPAGCKSQFQQGGRISDTLIEAVQMEARANLNEQEELACPRILWSFAPRFPGQLHQEIVHPWLTARASINTPKS